MPELPEVETLRRELKILVNKTISNVEVRAPKIVLPFSVPEFAKRLKGENITSVERRAKILLIELTSGSILTIHLKMTGQLIYAPKGKAPIVGGHPQKGGIENLPNKYTHLIIDFTDGTKLYFNDLRKFGWARLVTKKEFEVMTAHIGIEPLSKAFTAYVLETIIKKYPRRPIKQLLLDQTLIAGIGNIYADESCFLAKILPMEIAGKLHTKEIKKLHEAIIYILKLSIQKKGTSAKNYLRSNGKPGGMVPHLNVYGRGKEVCKVCGTTLTKIKFNGRGTHFCSQCQKPL